MNAQTETRLIEYKPTERRDPVNIEAVIALHNAQIPSKEIAEELETSVRNVNRICQRYNIEAEIVKDFTDNESLIQNGAKEKVVKAMLDGTIPIKSAKDFKDAAIAYGKIFEVNRLQENRSTANVAVNINDISPDTMEKMQKFIKDLY
jgi:hypothetical protein